MTSNLPILLFMIPFVAALLCTGATWLWRSAVRPITLASLTLLAGTTVWAGLEVADAGRLQTHMGGWTPAMGIELALDSFSLFVTALVALVALVVLAGSRATIRRELSGREGSFYTCALLLISGLTGMLVTADLFNLFVHVEVASLSAYALVACGRRGAAQAALKYLVVGTLGASLYLLGVGFIYAAVGTLNMAEAAERIGLLTDPAGQRLVLVGGMMILLGLGTKMALMPLHLWMPAAYAYAPAVSTALMAPLVTKVSAYALLRVFFWVYPIDFMARHPILLEALVWAGSAAILVGAALALLQRDLWRLLVYSSISQMGVIALGAGLGNSSGITGATLHIANDALMKGSLFLAAGLVLCSYRIRTVDDLGRLRGQVPWTGAAIVVVGLSLVGIPPLSGFFGKWYVLVGALEAGRWELAAVLVIGSLVTAAYVFRILEQLYYSRREDPAPPVEPTSRSLLGASLLLALGVILLGLWNEPVVRHLILPALPAGL